MELDVHGWNLWHVLYTWMSSYALQRWLTSIVQAMPPLPANANWGETFLYNLAKLVAQPTPAAGGKS